MGLDLDRSESMGDWSGMSTWNWKEPMRDWTGLDWIGWSPWEIEMDGAHGIGVSSCKIGLVRIGASPWDTELRMEGCVKQPQACPAKADASPPTNEDTYVPVS